MNIPISWQNRGGRSNYPLALERCYRDYCPPMRAYVPKRSQSRLQKRRSGGVGVHVTNEGISYNTHKPGGAGVFRHKVWMPLLQGTSRIDVLHSRILDKAKRENGSPIGDATEITS